MERRSPNIRDVAARAHVSITTVSRVINRRAGVHPQTRANVWKVIQDLNYPVPDRSLTHIHVHYPDFNTRRDYTQLVTSGIAQEACELGIPVVFSSKLQTQALSGLAGRSADSTDGVLGVIVHAGHPAFEGYTTECRTSRDTVYVWLNSPPNGRHAVNVDTYSATYRATSRLVQLGHRRLAMVSQTTGTWHARQRLRGFQDAIRACGNHVVGEYVHWGHDWLNEMGAWLQRVLARSGSDRPTAVIGATATCAQALYMKLLQARIRLPDDLSFIGFGRRLAQDSYPYDTIAQPTRRMGVEAVRLLHRVSLRPQTTFEHLCLSTTFKPGGTTGRPPPA